MSRPLFALFGLSCIFALTVATAWASTNTFTPTIQPNKTPRAKATEKAEEGKAGKAHYQGIVMVVS